LGDKNTRLKNFSHPPRAAVNCVLGQTDTEYLLGLNGEQVSVLGATGNWLWTNVYAGGQQLATYDNTGTHFTLTDGWAANGRRWRCR
jgi:hypothetical protein